MKVLGKKFIIFALALSISLLLGASFSIAQEKMSMDEYKAQLADWQQREADAKGAGDNCSSDVEKLKGEIEAAQAEKEQVWQDILAQWHRSSRC